MPDDRAEVSGGEQLGLLAEADAPAADAAEAPHPPTAEQGAAIGARDRDVFLEAGAGTGKTRVLVERYCEAVDADEIPPERILAFTFTEKAAAEMRGRVRAELARRATTLPPSERRERLEAAARAGEAASITTIHGFCRRLLAARPLAAGLDPRFRVLDAREAQRLSRQAFERALEELASSDDAVALTAAGYRGRLADVVIAAHAEMRNHGEREPTLPPIQIEAIDRTDEPPSPAEVEALSGGYEALRELVAGFGRHYEELKAERSGVDFDDLQLLALELMRRSPAIALAQRERFLHLLVDEFQDTSPIQAELIRAIAGPETRVFRVGDEAQSIYAFRGADLASFRRERLRATRDAGTASLALTGSFRSTPDVVAAVNVVGATLLDDFRPLRVGKPPEEAPAGPRGPAVELLLTERDGWGEEDAGTELATAAAETPQSRVAEARGLARRLRELADEGVEPGSMVVLLRAFTHVDAYAEALELAGLEPRIVGGRGYWSAQQVGDALALLGCVANPLDDEALLGALASPACGASPDALWMLRRIAGRRRHLWPALARLADGGDEEAGDDAGDVPAPGDWDGGRASAAGETTADADEAREWAARIPADDRERLGDFHDRLVALRERAPLLPLDELVEEALSGFGYDLATLLMDGGERRSANLAKLVALAAEHEAHEGRDLRAFLESMRARAALSDREVEAEAGGEEASPGVRVMTIHAAKGLEFECVAVADLGRSLTSGGRPPELRVAYGDDEDAEPADPASRRGAGSRKSELSRPGVGHEARDDAEPASLRPPAASRRGAGSRKSEPSRPGVGHEARDDAEPASLRPPAPRIGLRLARPGAGSIDLAGYADLGAAAAEAEAEESGRLAYVAVSRARSRLLLSGTFQPERDLEGNGRSALSALLPALGVSGENGQALTLPAAEVREELDLEPRPGTMLVSVRAAGSASAAELRYDRRAARAGAASVGGRPPLTALAERGAAAARSLSYAALADYRRCGYRFLSERVLRLAPPAPGPGREGERASNPAGFGSAVHALLEWSARTDWRAPGEELIRAALAREGSDPDREGEAGELIAGWLSSPLLAELRDAGAAFQPELGFRFAAGSESLIRGTIDLLATAPGEPPTIVDYKTDALPGGAAPATLVGAYELQRGLYAAAVAAATGAESVRAAYIFLRAPGDPVVATLDEPAIAAARDATEPLLESIRRGDFSPTDRPHAALCHDCPARARLCPHPPELTLRAEATPVPAAAPAGAS